MPLGGAGVGDSDPTIMLQRLAEDYLESAKISETSGKIQKAYKLYCEAANKFHYILKNHNGIVDQMRLRDLKEKT
jgi:hypothetical protein